MLVVAGPRIDLGSLGDVPAGVTAPHLQLSVQYLRAALPGHEIVCRGRCLTKGRRVFAAEGEAWQGERLVARAATTHLVSD